MTEVAPRREAVLGYPLASTGGWWTHAEVSAIALSAGTRSPAWPSGRADPQTQADRSRPPPKQLRVQKQLLRPASRRCRPRSVREGRRSSWEMPPSHVVACAAATGGACSEGPADHERGDVVAVFPCGVAAEVVDQVAGVPGGDVRPCPQALFEGMESARAGAGLGDAVAAADEGGAREEGRPCDDPGFWSQVRNTKWYPRPRVSQRRRLRRHRQARSSAPALPEQALDSAGK